MGQNARVVVNPETRQIASVNPLARLGAVRRNLLMYVALPRGIRTIVPALRERYCPTCFRSAAVAMMPENISRRETNRTYGTARLLSRGYIYTPQRIVRPNAPKGER